MKKGKQKWVAVYLPDDTDNGPTKGGFNSKTEARNWIIKNQLCKECKKYKLASACGSEWVVITESEYKKANTFEDLLKSAGYEKINLKDKK